MNVHPDPTATELLYRALAAPVLVFVISVPLAWIESPSKGYVFRGQGQVANFHVTQPTLVPQPIQDLLDIDGAIGGV